MTRFLIEKGADVNAKDDNGGTALYRAIFGNSLNELKYSMQKMQNYHS